MDWLKKAPASVTIAVVIVCGFLALGVLGSFVYLTANGHDTTEFRQWVQTIGQLLVFPLLGVTAVASVAGARASSSAEDNTNGNLTALQQEKANLEARNALLTAQLERTRPRDPGTGY